MEPVAVVKPKGRRGRKRKISNEENAMVDCNGISNNGVKARSLRLLSRYVRKEFPSSGVFLGRVLLYNSGLYRIKYEDGDFEDLDGSEVKMYLVEDCDLTGKWLERKQKLDDFLKSSKEDVNAKVLKIDETQLPENVNMSNADASVCEVVKIDYNCNGDVKTDCSSDSCEDTEGGDTELVTKVPLVPPPELPPSSGHIGVPEEYVSHLLSVYSFLRSFSVPLFLYPFKLDDFVGALNCSVANTLLDSVHVALLRVLKLHLERLSSGGSELASKCLRCQDWSLLDTLTWPIYLVHYLMLLGDRNGQDWKRFYVHSLERDYYSLPAGKKLVVMQILCEGVLDSEEIRIELDSREESEVGIDIDTNTMVTTSKTRSCNHSMEPGVGGLAKSSTDEDGNGDECRLCGMDGLLVCCDGCPSSYHSRCLGLNKMFMPDNSWYCPECKINATEPKILQGSALKGGDILGVDPYEQVFVVSCDHLLVLKASVYSGSCLRYYNGHDIPGVLRVLYSKEDHVVAYTEICRGIMQYWEIPQDILPFNVMSQGGLQPAHKEGFGECSTQLFQLLDNVPDISASSENTLGTSFVMKSTKTEPVSYSVNGQPAGPCHISQNSTSSVTKSVSCVSRSRNIEYNSPMNGNLLEPKASITCPEFYSKADRKGIQSGCCFYMGSSFQPNSFINYYIHGGFAASAAANLAIFYPEENQVLSRSSVNHRKVLSASAALQVKAFSSGATRFFWPNTEKKLVEVPRERCGWCFNCKATVSNKRGCLLNAAASNVTRGSMKALAGFRPVKNRDGRLHGIATYILFMEESLSGLLCGPFLNGTFRNQWRKQVEQATSCNEIKIRLLELEENIRTIAISGDWTKIVEGGYTQSSISQTAASVAGSTQKRRPGRPGKKYAASVEAAVDDYQEIPTNITWWRGGRLSKLMFQSGILPCSIIRISARQGGTKEILGIYYAEGNVTPKSNKQLFWRSSVEMSRNMAKLALLVRYLDFHVRWGDLVRPEQSNCDGKGSEAKAHAFRNAFICDKKLVGLEIRYSVAFGSQKHLSSRIMKNIREVEHIPGDEKDKYWFSETYIPLYLIKEYEQKVEQNMPVNLLPKLRRGHSKTSHRNIFSDLFWKQNTVARSCCSCHQDVFYRNVVKCSKCQGFCHEHCTTRSTVNMSKKEAESLITCMQCETRTVPQVQSSNRSHTSPLPFQGQGFSNPPTPSKLGKSVGHIQVSSASMSVREEQHYSSEVKSTNQTSVAKKNRKAHLGNKKKHLGLIWRKNNCEDTGIDFRLKNIILRGNPYASLVYPTCQICMKLYNADLTYIFCDTCQRWFHADAVGLEESKIFLLLGFKCCKCRRSRSPICPYMDPEIKKELEERERKLTAKHEISATNNLGMTPEVGLDYSASVQRADIINGGNNYYHHNNNAAISGPGPGSRKLPVRRLPNQGIDVDAGETDNLDRNSGFEGNYYTTPQVQWLDPNFDDSVITLDYDCLGGDVGDVEFEPQTYFSVNELFGPDDGNAIETTGNVIENCERENGMLEISYGQEEEPTISWDTDIELVAPCRICSCYEPYPDLCCQICGVWIHKGCSPWLESSSSWEDGWRCGYCRECR